MQPGPAVAVGGCGGRGEGSDGRIWAVRAHSAEGAGGRPSRRAGAEKSTSWRRGRGRLHPGCWGNAHAGVGGDRRSWEGWKGVGRAGLGGMASCGRGLGGAPKSGAGGGKVDPMAARVGALPPRVLGQRTRGRRRRSAAVGGRKGRRESGFGRYGRPVWEALRGGQVGSWRRKSRARGGGGGGAATALAVARQMRGSAAIGGRGRAGGASERRVWAVRRVVWEAVGGGQVGGWELISRANCGEGGGAAWAAARHMHRSAAIGGRGRAGGASECRVWAVLAAGVGGCRGRPSRRVGAQKVSRWRRGRGICHRRRWEKAHARVGGDRRPWKGGKGVGVSDLGGMGGRCGRLSGAAKSEGGSSKVEPMAAGAGALPPQALGQSARPRRRRSGFMGRREGRQMFGFGWSGRALWKAQGSVQIGGRGRQSLAGGDGSGGAATTGDDSRQVRLAVEVVGGGRAGRASEGRRWAAWVAPWREANVGAAAKRWWQRRRGRGRCRPKRWGGAGARGVGGQLWQEGWEGVGWSDFGVREAAGKKKVHALVQGDDVGTECVPVAPSTRQDATTGPLAKRSASIAAKATPAAPLPFSGILDRGRLSRSSSHWLSTCAFISA